MNSRQGSKSSMFLAVKDYLTANAAIVNLLPNFAGFLTAFLNAITQIQTYGEQQMFDKTGLKVNKNQLKSALVVLAADASRKLQAYAKFANNQLLLSETKFTESDLKNANDNELRDFAQGIYNRAQSNLTALTPYGITAATQTAFLAAINAYVVSIPKPRVGTAESKMSTLQLANAFAAAEAALGNIDAVIEITKLTQSNFYNGYKTVRKIIETGTSTLSVKGMITDAVSGEPVKGVTVSFALDGGMAKAKSAGTQTPELIKKSAEKGGFNVKSLATGTYIVTLKKAGYADQVATISVNDGEMTELNVMLERA